MGVDRAELMSRTTVITHTPWEGFSNPGASKIRESSGTDPPPRSKDRGTNKINRGSPKHHLQASLVFTNKQPLGSRNSSGLQIGIRQDSSTLSSHSRSIPIPATMPGIGPGSRGFATQGCHRTNFSSRRFLQAYLCSPQGRWGMAPNYQPEEIEWVHCNTSFQDGVYCQSEGCDPERGLYGEIKPERWLPIGPYCTRTSQVSQICMERSVLSVPITAISSGLSPENLYETPLSSGSGDVIQGHKDRYIPGRYPCPGQLQEPADRRFGFSGQAV